MEKGKAKLVIKEFQDNELPKDIIRRKIISVDTNSKSIIAVYGPCTWQKDNDTIYIVAYVLRSFAWPFTGLT